MKDQFGEAPATIKRVRELGACAVLVTCAAPCRRQASVMLDALHLPDETVFNEIAKLRRFRCDECRRRATKVEVDWDRGKERPASTWGMTPPG